MGARNWTRVISTAIIITITTIATIADPIPICEITAYSKKVLTIAF
jgi:hypothetical protein